RTDPGPPPLSFAQQRLWLVDRMAPGQSTYNMPIVVKMTGPLDVPQLQRTFTVIVQRHEVLRTVFAVHDEQIVQIIRPALDRVALPVVDLEGVSADRREALAERWSEAEAGRPFDLMAGPLCRLQLLRLSHTQHWLLLTLHHIVADGWSMGVLVREIHA